MTRRAVVVALATLVTSTAGTVWASGSASSATVAGTVIGEGGDAMTPVMVKLLHDDAGGLNPDFGSYTNVNLDQGIKDFIGTAPGAFANDFAVTERPLTSAEAATAKANGRSYAYVPFVATPVALLTLVPNPTYSGSATILPSQFCQHIPLTLTQLDGIYGAPAYTGWGDTNLSCTSPPNTPAAAYAFGLWANLDPTIENYTLESFLDSTTASQTAFAAGLAAAEQHGLAATGVTTTASEHWPYSTTAVEGGDEATLGKLIGLDARTAAPSTVVADIQMGAIMPIASVWTGDPLGVTWNLPTAAVQNAQGSFVAPSSASAGAAEADATLASTSDPTTNNLVTFNAGTSDQAAYNNYLMMESYLLVPTNGLPADKALALAQFIRFAVGAKGQADITALGAAPATPKMVTADLAVAQELDAEAASAPATTPTSTSTPTSSSGTTTATTATGTSSSGTGGSSAGDAPSAATTAASTSGGLAFTGDDPLPLLGLGFALLMCGEGARQLLRRRRASR